ncbi:pilus assembly FimT family protein [Desulfatitalea alkaliphila]|uniref:Type II secretion system protein H n=1 Tax=Desulfatitalea alkaliphila TaxID=2929485 RepID=A0AA41UJI6_9BACT|nr:GspH/FimT family pseudopilin [Desulfatitalea alkaliphila]MCJ8501975.1 GspH/FimT family pseudopilin [Desulfatitalea alkaliphila]
MRLQAGNRSTGFTVLEVVLVLVFISIFATVAVLRQPPTDVTLKAQIATLKSYVRYAQSRAINTGTPWGIHYDSDDRRFWLFAGNDSNNRRPLPGETENTTELAGGVTITPAGFTLCFDTWGRPGALATQAEQDHCTPLTEASDLHYILTKNGETESFIIHPETGFIP